MPAVHIVKETPGIVPIGPRQAFQSGGIQRRSVAKVFDDVHIPIGISVINTMIIFIIISRKIIRIKSHVSCYGLRNRLF